MEGYITKEQIKKKLQDCLYYMNMDSPLKGYHSDRYNCLIKHFNLLLAREIK